MIPLLLTAALAAEPPTTGRPFEARPRRAWDVLDVAMDLKVDPAARTLEGRIVQRIAPLGLPDDRLRLHQEALTIERVTVDGVISDGWRLGEGTLDVPVVPGQPHEVVITWSATPETGVHFRAGKGADALQAWTQNEDEDGRWWFPTWDHPSDTFPVAVSLTVPDGLHAVANGVLQGKAPSEPGWTRWSYRLEQPIAAYLVAFAVGEHAVLPVPGPIPMEVVAPVGIPEAVARRGLDRAQEMATFFGDLLDEPYPYPVYRQIVVQRFLYGGMENATATTVADDALDDDGSLAIRAESLVAHELAHQWFGDLLTCHGWRELWLNEGFATFYAARWAEARHGEEDYAAEVLEWAAESVATTTPVANRDWAAPAAPPSTAVYGRGAMILHQLRVWLGDAVFDEAIRRYVDAHRFGLVETDDLRQAFEAVTGNDLRWWFDRQVHGWGAPSIRTSWSADGGRLQVAIVQADDAHAWEGPVQVAWADAAGVHEQELWLRPGATTLDVAADAPRWVMVDPRGGVLARWTRGQPAEAWAAALAEAPTAYARLVAATALGDVAVGQDTAAKALAAALAAEPPAVPSFPTDRLARAAAAALGTLGTPAARDALLAAAPRPGRPWLRADVAWALRAFPLDPAVATTLERLAAKTDEPRVAAAALHALAEVWPSRARVAAEKALDGRDPSRTGALHAAALDVFGASRQPAVLDRVVAYVGEARRDVQRAAGRAAVELARAEAVPDARRARVALALTPWLDHEDQRIRQLGIHLLARLGADEALPALQAFAARSTVPSDRDAARAAVTHLRATAGPTPTDPDALLRAQATLESLKEELEALQERVERLEK